MVPVKRIALMGFTIIWKIGNVQVVIHHVKHVKVLLLMTVCHAKELYSLILLSKLVELVVKQVGMGILSQTCVSLVQMDANNVHQLLIAVNVCQASYTISNNV